MGRTYYTAGMSLEPCATCHRHVHAGTTCPFCGLFAAKSGPRPTAVGRMSRAMVFAGATLAAGSACGGKSKPANNTMPDEQEHNINEGHRCVPPDQKRIE